jgi:manganese efflux pump family protein
MLQLLLFLLPLGIDTLGISISLGITSTRTQVLARERAWPLWLRSAILFSLAETAMPLIGLIVGYAVSLMISSIMHYVGPLLLIGVGLWELIEETRERLHKKPASGKKPSQSVRTAQDGQVEQEEKQFDWGRQFLLALSVSLDELAVGFSLGSVTLGKNFSPLTLCILIGLQGFLMTLTGIGLGRTLRTRLKPVKEWSELLSGLLLMALGVWLLLT